MVLYEIVRKEDNALMFVEKSPPVGLHKELFEVHVIEVDAVPAYTYDDDGTFTCPPTVPFVLLEDYVGAGQKQKDLETKVAELTVRVATAETKVTKAEADIVALKTKVGVTIK